MSLNATELESQILGAFKGVLAKKWSEVKDYASTEAKKLAENLVLIEKQKVTKSISEQQAKLEFQIHKNAAHSVLLTVEGLGELTVEQAMSTAIAEIKQKVNSALGFELL